MAYIYKPTRIDRKTGQRVKCRHWHIIYIDETGRRRHIQGYTDKAASEAKAKELQKQVDRSKAGLLHRDSDKRNEPLENVIQEYLNELERRNSARFHISESGRLLTKIKDGCRWKRLADIRAGEFGEFLAGLARKGRAPRTQNRHHETLRSFLNFCVERGWLEESPIARMKMLKVGEKGRRRRRRAYTVDEFRRLIAAAPQRAAVYAVAAFSGLRRSELLRLEKQDVQPMKWVLRGDITKNGRAENLPMMEECWEYLKPLWEQAKKPTDRIFQTLPDAKTIIDDLRRAEIPRKDDAGRSVDFHALRYFFCTVLARTLPIQTVRLLMRHRDIRMTCNLYMDLGLDDVNEAVLRLPRILQSDQNQEKEDQGASHP